MHIVHLRLYLLPLTRIHVVRRLMNGAGGNQYLRGMAETPLSWMGAESPRADVLLKHGATYTKGQLQQMLAATAVELSAFFTVHKRKAGLNVSVLLQ
jgi:hypothetical protein